jgi:GT2 family glycosyltransferase
MSNEPTPLESLEAERRPVIDDLTVVIPTLGREILQDCLGSIARGTAWPARIVVVDQGSSPRVAKWMETMRTLGLDAEQVPSAERGRSSGVNRGIERVATRFLVVTDDDCLVDRDWLSRMAERMRANPEAIVTGRVDPEGAEEVVALMTSTTAAVYRRPRIKHDSMCGGNMGAAKAVLERLGLFDEDPRLRTAEDCEFSYRALSSGVPIIYAPEAVVKHVGWRGPAERAAQYRAYARSIGGFYGKYLRRGDLFIALRVVVHHARALKRWLRGLLVGDRDLALNGRAYLVGTLPGILAGLRRR